MTAAGTKAGGVYRERVFPVLFMFVVTALFIAVVSGIYLSTRELVVRNESLFLKRAVLYAAGFQAPQSAADVEALYRERIVEERAADGPVLYYEVRGASGRPAGYVVPGSGPGLWGKIVAVVGLDQELRTITGVDFTDQNETPGLGARIVEPWFREQFRGKRGPFRLVPEGSGTLNPDEFDAITGATKTSTAVRDILNNTLSAAKTMIR